MDRRDISKVLLGSVAGAALLSERAVAQSCVAPCYAQTAAEIAASVTPTNTAYAPGYLQRYKSGSLAVDATNDWSAALQAACNQCAVGGTEVVIPGAAGFYRCNTTIGLTGGCRLRGEGTQPSLRFYGCDGFVLPQGQSNFSISSIELFSLSAGGSVDPKNYSGITTAGVLGAACNYLVCRDLYLRGWHRCVDMSFTWNSAIDNCTTINCNIGVRLYGQSVNNHISNCRLGANTGTHSIKCEKDPSGIRGEGLLVTNSLLAMGTYGLQTDGFLSLDVVNCTVDLIGDTAIDLTNVPALNISNSWIYAANKGIHWHPLSVPVVQQATISSCRIETTANNSLPLHIDYHNEGISITGGSLTCPAGGTARCAYIEVDSPGVSMVGTHLVNPSGNTSIYAGATGFRNAALTGNASITYNAPDQFTGTLTQCTTAPTAQILYSVTGDLVTLQIPSLAGLSANSNQPLITGMPAAIRPKTLQFVAGQVLNNSTPVIGMIAVQTNGNLTLYNGAGTVFSSANAKGAMPCTITYRRV